MKLKLEITKFDQQRTVKTITMIKPKQELTHHLIKSLGQRDVSPTEKKYINNDSVQKKLKIGSRESNEEKLLQPKSKNSIQSSKSVKKPLAIEQ